MSEVIPEIKYLISYLRTKGMPKGCAECQSPEWAAATVIEHMFAENNELKEKINKLELEIIDLKR